MRSLVSGTDLEPFQELFWDCSRNGIISFSWSVKIGGHC